MTASARAARVYQDWLTELSQATDGAMPRIVDGHSLQRLIATALTTVAAEQREADAMIAAETVITIPRSEYNSRAGHVLLTKEQIVAAIRGGER